MKRMIIKWLGIIPYENYLEEIDLRIRYTLEQPLKEIKELKEKIKSVDYLKEGYSVPEGSLLYHIKTHLLAIEDYLKVDIKWEWQNDPARLPEPLPQIKVWKAFKRKKYVNKKSN